MARQTKILDRQFHPAGQTILKQGTSGMQAFLIESGKVEVFTTDSQGHITIIGEAGVDEIIGEMAPLQKSTRCASVRTVEDTVLIAISGHTLHTALTRKRTLFQKLMNIIAWRMQSNKIYHNKGTSFETNKNP